MAEAVDAIDRTLLARARGGEAEAFCRLMRAEEARVFRQALALVGDRSVAEDLAAETFVAAWQSFGRFDGGCRLSTWLYAILLHRFQKHLRRGRSRIPSAAPAEGGSGGTGGPEEADGGPTGADAAVQAEEERLWRRALAELPEEHRDVLLLRFFEDASLAEIGSALGIPVGTVKSRLHHGLEKLRRMEVVVNLRMERRDS